MNNIAICLSSDNNYVQHLAAAISSVLKHKNDQECVCVYIIDGGISEENKEKLSFFTKNYACEISYILPDMNKLKSCHTFKRDYISLAAYYRLFIPELIPNEDRIIYMDCDVIARASLNELYNKEFNNNLVLGVIDVAVKPHSKRLNLEKYINSGVMLLNCQGMREENSVEKIVDWIANNQAKIECHDQDIINAVFEGRIGYIEKEFNTQAILDNEGMFKDVENPVLIHFISPKKPWTFYKPMNYTKWAKEYFEALKGTPWEDFIEYHKRKIMWYFPLRLFYPTGNAKAICEQIFSVRNSSDRKYKIIRILGFKFQKRRVKQISE